MAWAIHKSKIPIRLTRLTTNKLETAPLVVLDSRHCSNRLAVVLEGTVTAAVRRCGPGHGPVHGGWNPS